MGRPGCLVRGTLVAFGVLFLSLAVFFIWKRDWGQAVILALVAAAFLRVGLARGEHSWLSAIDDLDMPRRDQ